MAEAALPRARQPGRGSGGSGSRTGSSAEAAWSSDPPPGQVSGGFDLTPGDALVLDRVRSPADVLLVVRASVDG